MKNTIRLAALGACALAASSTAVLAGSELPAGITTGLALGSPLPEGVYDISIGSYGSRNVTLGNLAYGLPVWLVWSTPWQIAGGRVHMTSTTGAGDLWTSTSSPSSSTGIDSWLNSFVDAGIKWNLGNGWNAGFMAGVWMPSTQALPIILGRNYAAFQAQGAVSYLANGWNLSATAVYGSGGGGDSASDHYQPAWFNLDLTATKKFGKYESGLIAYGSWDLDANALALGTKQSQFALGGLVGYDFGSFVAQVKVASDVTQENYGDREVRGWLTIIKPLWNPETAGSLK